MERRLAAILATDVVGYSRLIRADEEGTIAALKALRVDLIDLKIAEHHGRIVKLMGDGMLAEFPSVVDAVRAAVETQLAVAEHNSGLPEDKRIEFRVGINLGDVIIDGDDIHGDGVNVAARLEGIADPSGICISGAVYDQVRDRVDAIFEDMGEQEVKNIDRPVRMWRWLPDRGVTGGDTAPPEKPLPLPDKPSIVVLPFENMSGEAEQEFFADGLSEDIITALSRFHSFDVVGRNTAFTFKGRSVDLKTVAQELGVQYILEGSVRKAGNRVRISAQLIDGLADHHIWAERYDRELDDIFQVQDEIIEIIVATLAHKVDAEETERRIRTHETDRDAYDCYLTGREYFFTRTRQAHYRSIALIDRAIELDPEFARAHGFRAWLKAYGCRYGWSDNSKQCLDEAMSSALKALSLDPSDYDVHWRLAVAYLHARQFDKAEGEYRKAQALNPNHAGFLAEMAGTLVLLGRPEDAIAQLEQAKRNNPQYPEWFDAYLGWAQYHAGQHDSALETLNALNDPPGVFRIFVAGAQARLDRLDEARAEATRLLASEPGFSLAKLEFLPYKNDADRAMLAADLCKAGID